MTGDFDVFNVSGIKYRVRYRKIFDLIKFDYLLKTISIERTTKSQQYPLKPNESVTVSFRKPVSFL